MLLSTTLNDRGLVVVLLSTSGCFTKANGQAEVHWHQLDPSTGSDLERRTGVEYNRVGPLVVPKSQTFRLKEVSGAQKEH